MDFLKLGAEVFFSHLGTNYNAPLRRMCDLADTEFGS